MHELSLARAVIDTVERHAGGRPVVTITLRVGALRQVVPESLEFYVGIAGKDTVCEGAELELELVAATFRCSGCGHVWAPDEPAFRCGRCGSPGDVVSGNELEVESIVVEEVEPCIAHT